MRRVIYLIIMIIICSLLVTGCKGRRQGNSEDDIEKVSSDAVSEEEQKQRDLIDTPESVDDKDKSGQVTGVTDQEIEVIDQEVEVKDQETEDLSITRDPLILVNRGDSVFQYPDTPGGLGIWDEVDIYFNPIIEDELIHKAMSPYEVDYSISHQGNEVTHLSLKDLKIDEEIVIKKDFAIENNRLFSKDIVIRLNANPHFKLYRLDNKTERYQINYDYLTSDKLMVEVHFSNRMNRTSVENTIMENINVGGSKIKPSFNFEWQNDQTVVVSIEELVKGYPYQVDLSGATDIDNKPISGLRSNRDDVGGMFETVNIIYRFTIGPEYYLARYSFEKDAEEVLSNLASERNVIGAISENNRWLLMGFNNEWGTCMSIFDIEKEINYFLGDNIAIWYHEGAFIDNHYAVFEYKDNQLYKLKYINLETLTIDNILIQEMEGFNFRKNPFKQGYSSLTVEEEKLFLVNLDDNMSRIDKIQVPFNNFDNNNERIMGHFYWINEDVIAFSTEKLNEYGHFYNEDKPTTYFFDLSTGKLKTTLDDIKIISYDDVYKRLLLFDNRLNEFLVYDDQLNLIHKFTLPFEALMSSSPYGITALWKTKDEVMMISVFNKYISYNISKKEFKSYEIDKDMTVLKHSSEDKWLIVMNAEAIDNEGPFRW